MTILEQKYSEFPFNEEFTDLYMLLLYESGGDFLSYSKILGYEDIKFFYKDFNEFWLKFHILKENPFKDKIQEIEWLDTFTSLIRYGYQEAIDEIINFVSDNCNSEELGGIIQDKLSSMKRTKHQINFQKLQSECQK